MVVSKTDDSGNMAKGVKQKVEISEHGKIKLLVLIAGALVIISLMAYVADGFAEANQGQLSLSTCAHYLNPLGRYQCVVTLANTTDNISVCSALQTGQADECYYSVALGRHNISACNLIVGNGIAVASSYDQCVLSLATSPSDIGYCGALPVSEGLQCLYNLSAMTGFNMNECSQISNSFFSNECSYLNFYHQAQQMKDTGYCGYLQSSDNYTTLALLLMNGTHSFSTINLTQSVLSSYYFEVNISPRDYCYFNLAKSEDNRSICSLTTTKAGSALCDATFEGALV